MQLNKLNATKGNEKKKKIVQQAHIATHSTYRS